MKPWQQTLIIGGLGIVGALTGLAAATFVLGPTTLLGTPVGQWTAEKLFGQGPTLSDGRQVIQIGDIVPNLPVNTLSGDLHTLQFGTQPVLINYWASWCGPCIEEMPLLDAFAKEQAQFPNGIRVVGIALDDMESVTTFLENTPVDFPVYLEQSGPSDSSVLLGNIRGVLPYSVLIDTTGQLARRKIGAFHTSELPMWVLGEAK